MFIYRPLLHELPLEIITKIVKLLSLSDILNLATVSKDWRCLYLNQNAIWREMCQKISVQEEDYTRCLIDMSRNDTHCRGYMETKSNSFFGPFCKMWSIYNQYNVILRNIKNNDFPTIHITRKNVHSSFCTDDYIANVYLYRKSNTSLEVACLGGYNTPVKYTFLKLTDWFYKLLRNKLITISIIGNKKFLVIEINSVISVYTVENYQFVLKYTKVIQRSTEEKLENTALPSQSFLDSHSGTIIDISDDKLALVHPKENTILLIDLKSGDIFREIVYCKRSCTVDCMKYVDEKVMIGLTFQVN